MRAYLRSTRNDETFTGRVVKFNYYRANYRIFKVDGHQPKRSGWCKGYIIGGKEIRIGDIVHLEGSWRVDPQYPSYGEQFFFTGYKMMNDNESDLADEQISKPAFRGNEKKQQNEAKRIIVRKKDGTEKTIIRDRKKNDGINGFLLSIGQMKISYEFHEPSRNTIAQHAKQQLYERIIESSPAQKDFFLLTALLDRNTRDKNIQVFRDDNQDFKNKLLKCWKEAPDLLEYAAENIKNAVKDKNLLSSLEGRSRTFKYLLSALPGRSRINQLLVCLNIINKNYKRRQDITCTGLLSNFHEEQIMRDNLLQIYGVGEKLANWSLTNATGHWFVIDLHIKKAIKNHLSHTTRIAVQSKNADAIFFEWFGELDEANKSYSKLSKKDFVKIFTDFKERDCEYLPFIITQYLWFYGKFCER